MNKKTNCTKCTKRRLQKKKRNTKKKLFKKYKKTKRGGSNNNNNNNNNEEYFDTMNKIEVTDMYINNGADIYTGTIGVWQASWQWHLNVCERRQVRWGLRGWQEDWQWHLYVCERRQV